MCIKEAFKGCTAMSVALRHALLQSKAAAIVLPILTGMMPSVAQLHDHNDPKQASVCK